jgi:pyruvate dehydrogenase E1 component alpha subunit
MTAQSKKITSAATAAASVQNGFSLISNEKLLELYFAMVKGRMLGERARVHSGKLPENGSAAKGREAAAVGVLLDLGREDFLAPAPGDLLAAYLKGAPLDRIFARPGGLDSLGDDSLNVLPACANPATRLAIAAGVALAGKLKSSNQLTVAFCDAAAATTKLCQQAWHFAGAHSLPILYVCWNSRPARDLYLEAAPCGFPGIAVDGHDVVAVYRVACEAIAHACKGNGPTLIECKSGLGSGGEDGDAILNMEKYLTRKGLFREEEKRQVAVEFKGELDSAWKRRRSKALVQEP